MSNFKTRHLSSWMERSVIQGSPASTGGIGGHSDPGFRRFIRAMLADESAAPGRPRQGHRSAVW
jgi:hypothetical protein